MKYALISAAFIILNYISFAAAQDKKLIFYESFDSETSLQANGASYSLGASEFVPGLKQNALFLKNDESLSYSIPEQPLKSGTIEFYFKAYSNYGGLVDLLDKKYTNKMGFINGWLYLEQNTGSNQSSSLSEVSQQKWHHAALVWGKDADGSCYGRAYLDGVGDKDWESCPDNLLNGPFTLKVGESYFYDAISAEFDDLKIYNYALSPSAIKSRARLISKDPKRYFLKLLTPENGETLTAGTYGVWGFEWTGPSAKYALELSTSSNFAANTFIKVKYYSDEWITGMFSMHIENDELKRLRKLTGYQGTQFYWRMVLRNSGKKVHNSEIRAVNIIPQ